MPQAHTTLTPAQPSIGILHAACASPRNAPRHKDQASAHMHSDHIARTRGIGCIKVPYSQLHPTCPSTDTATRTREHRPQRILHLAPPLLPPAATSWFLRLGCLLLGFARLPQHRSRRLVLVLHGIPWSGRRGSARRVRRGGKARRKETRGGRLCVARTTARFASARRAALALRQPEVARGEHLPTPLARRP